MKSIKDALLLYAVTDRSWLNNSTLKEQVEAALQGGVTLLQLREKEVTEDFFYQEALEIQQVCKEYNVPFIINDDVDLAIRIKADGIHVGQKDMFAKSVRKRIGDTMVLGVSCQNVEQAILAQEAGADYLGVGAIFNTQTKQDANAVTKDTLTKICTAVSIPVVAIGGIKEENIPTLKGTHIDGVAIISDIFSAKDITTKCKSLLKVTKQVVTYES